MSPADKKRATELAEFRLMLQESPLTARYLWRIMGRCDVFADPFDMDPIRMARNTGEKRSGQMILDDFMQGASDVLASLMMQPPPEPEEPEEQNDDG